MCAICRYATAKYVFIIHKKPVTEGRDLGLNISNLLSCIRYNETRSTSTTTGRNVQRMTATTQKNVAYFCIPFSILIKF